MTTIEREIEMLQQELTEGKIDIKEYNTRIREIERDMRRIALKQKNEEFFEDD